MKLHLIGHQRLIYSAVQGGELGGAVIRHPGAPDLSGPQELVQARGGIVDAGEPVRAMHEEELDMVRTHEPEGCVHAFLELGGGDIVKAHLATGVRRIRDIDACLGDDLQLVPQSGRESQRLAQHGFHLIQPVDLRRVDGGDPEFHTAVEPAVEFLRGGAVIQQAPGAIHHAGEFRSGGGDFGAGDHRELRGKQLALCLERIVGQQCFQQVIVAKNQARVGQAMTGIGMIVAGLIEQGAGLVR